MKVLISGCSFTQDHIWPEHLFKDAKIKNLAQGGAGNTFIANSIMSEADTFNPDFVFMVFSGINRIDLRTPVTDILGNTTYKTRQFLNSLYFGGGHALQIDKGWCAGYNNIKAKEWPEINSIKEWFNLSDDIKKECLDHKINLSTHSGYENLTPIIHQYFLLQNLDHNRKYFSELTFQNIMNCCNFLEKKNIPYRFTFIYDIFNKNEYFTHGRAVKEYYYNQIDWQKFIDFPPFNFGVKYDLLDNDGYHLTRHVGMIAWADEIKKLFLKDPEIAKFVI